MTVRDRGQCLLIRLGFVVCVFGFFVLLLSIEKKNKQGLRIILGYFWVDFPRGVPNFVGKPNS